MPFEPRMPWPDQQHTENAAEPFRLHQCNWQCAFSIFVFRLLSLPLSSDSKNILRALSLELMTQSWLRVSLGASERSTSLWRCDFKASGYALVALLWATVWLSLQKPVASVLSMHIHGVLSRIAPWRAVCCSESFITKINRNFLMEPNRNLRMETNSSFLVRLKL